jgi:hypothetical protein
LFRLARQSPFLLVNEIIPPTSGKRDVPDHTCLVPGSQRGTEAGLCRGMDFRRS